MHLTDGQNKTISANGFARQETREVAPIALFRQGSNPLRPALEIGLQYASYKFPASAPLLLLGGDIGRLVDYDAYRTFLEAQTRRYERVLLVLGNHEFYAMDYNSGISAARQLAGEPSLAGRLTLLHETR
ncbi:Ser/Thr protein phosphatase [Colletotrichum plurivorum]|uniref:Ser/Thr protein phosphatase n=1 Tax=Colletotrichum plurivorum TaxID=2175906 RepID=A0A8H6KBH4_9PEZI|nr:Ser/Thr protein phosphatase [Colletotrichum plurivorum]